MAIEAGQARGLLGVSGIRVALRAGHAHMPTRQRKFVVVCRRGLPAIDRVAGVALGREFWIQMVGARRF